MGFTLLAYGIQAVSGVILGANPPKRSSSQDSTTHISNWFLLHLISGISLVALVLLLLLIGLVGTLGHYGTLGQSLHLPSGLVVVGLVLGLAATALGILQKQGQARLWHRCLALILGLALLGVSWTGWDVVQKYL